ncbi:MAG: hypothetical protein ACM3MG_12760 [Bacillota bacterium]
MKTIFLSSLIMLISLASHASEVNGGVNLVRNDESGAVFMRIEGKAAQALYLNLQVPKNSGPASTFIKHGENISCYESRIDSSVWCAVNVDLSTGSLTAH